LLVAICSKPARPLREVAPHIRTSVSAIVKRALEIDPALRYQSADEFLIDLRKEVERVTLDDSMLDLKPDTVRADGEAKEAIELAATVAHVRGAQGDGTMRSATPLPGAVARPAGDRKRP